MHRTCKLIIRVRSFVVKREIQEHSTITNRKQQRRQIRHTIR